MCVLADQATRGAQISRHLRASDRMVLSWLGRNEADRYDSVALSGATAHIGGSHATDRVVL